MKIASTIARRLRHTIPGVLLPLVLLLAIACSSMHAQETIRPDSNAKLLKRIWMTRGSVIPGNEQIGSGTAGLGDINGDSIGDFAVRWGVDGRWRFYYGASPEPGTTPVWISDTSTNQLAVGDFWHTGHRAIAFGYYDIDTFNGSRYFGLRVHRTDHDSVDAQPSAVLSQRQQLCDKSMRTADLDGDGADELIVTKGCSFAELWIFKGGSSFSVDVPTKSLLDTQRLSTGRPYYTVVGDFDGDRQPDILTGGTYAAGQQLKFWFSSLHLSVWQWNQPDKVVTLTDEHPNFGNSGLVALDFDGDAILDLVLIKQGRVYIYCSARSLKSMVTRTFMLDDADRIYENSNMADPEPVGYLNDQRKQYAMLGLVGPDPRGNGKILAAFGGGVNGPDATYEAYYGARYDGLYDGLIYNEVRPIPDVSGDGWDDIIIGDWKYYDETLHPGIALVLAGGPYIPRDSTMLGVRDVAVGDRRDALSIWPVPARDELHIAWRGDRRRMPERFAVYDMLGRRVGEGSVDSWRGSVVWDCRDTSAGMYLLAIGDHDRATIATIVVRIQR